ncbi:hypothetical protein BV20DRAFT_85031 [Pilatotrama ljubarskyi]|nr:hypothetical protein BV20DRAFT_85031 [Pilatotrama ljubarskyi]
MKAKYPGMLQLRVTETAKLFKATVNASGRQEHTHVLVRLEQLLQIRPAHELWASSHNSGRHLQDEVEGESGRPRMVQEELVAAEPVVHYGSVLVAQGLHCLALPLRPISNSHTISRSLHPRISAGTRSPRSNSVKQGEKSVIARRRTGCQSCSTVPDDAENTPLKQ